MSAQRSFTQKLSKQHASEVRRNVATHQILPKSEINVTSGTTGCLEPVEPIDYEEFLLQHSNLISRDPLRDILDFPPNDLIIRQLQKKIRTLYHVMPKEELGTLPLYVQECVHCFTRPWKIVEFSHRKHSNSCCFRDRSYKALMSPLDQQEYELDSDCSSFDDSTLIYRSDSCTISSRQSIASLSSISGTETLTPRGSWASFDLRSSVHDPLLPGLLERQSSETIDQLNEGKRSEERQSGIYHLYQDTDDPDEFVERRFVSEIPAEHSGGRIMVKCLQLKLESGDVEPVFASMAIYDAKEKKKLSENFNFDLNPEAIKKMLNSHVPFADMSTQSRTALFEVSHPSHDLYLVIRLEKVLQGDTAEPYLKLVVQGEDKDKFREKAKSNAADFCERLGQYRMPFAWTGICLSNIFNGESSSSSTGGGGAGAAADKDDKGDRESLGAASSSNSLDRKSSTSSFDQLKKRATEVGGSFTRRGSLERRDKHRSWSPDDFIQSLMSFKPKTVTIPFFLRHESDKVRDEDLYKALPELKRPANLSKKFKSVPGQIVIEVSPAPEEVPYALTPELAKVNPYPDEKTRPVKEVLEFPAMPLLMPHFSYRNLLYINVKELNFNSRTGGSSRNLAIRVQLMAGERQSDALKAIFAKSSCPEFAAEAYTCVNYHNKCPSFNDEVKIALPGNLKQNHHLLFTIFHISCQKKPQEAQAPIETPVGYTWVPILQDGKLSVGEFNVPVMIEEPPENYSFIPPNVQLPGTKWLDNHRPVFSLSIDAVTSVHTLNPYLDKFITLCEHLQTRKVPPRIGEGNMEKEMKKSLNEIHLSDIEPLIKNLPVILDKLLELLVTTYRVGGETLILDSTVFMTLCQISQKFSKVEDLYPESSGRIPILSSYVQYQAFIPHPNNKSTAKAETHEAAAGAGGGDQKHQDGLVRLLHEQLVYQWVMASNEAGNLALGNSWLLFELIVKGMIEHLEQTRMISAARKGRFSHQLTHDIVTLIDTISRKIIDLHCSDAVKKAQNLNSSVAFFIFDLLSIMDRGFVFGLIKTYYNALKQKIVAVPELVNYKLDLLRIVCSHEHFVALNLPFATPYTVLSAPCSPTASVNSNNSQNSYLNALMNSDNSLYAELSQEFRQQHFLVGLVLTELATVLEIQNSSLHGKAIRCVRNLMTWHDGDARFTDRDARARVATLYLPLLGIVMDAIPQFHQFLVDSHDRFQSIGLLDDYQGPLVSHGNPTINPEVAFAISGSRMYSFNIDPSKNKSPLSSENTRHLLSCCLWILKNLDNAVLYRWMLGMPPHRLHKMLQVLNTCLPAFEYIGKKRRPVRRNPSSFRKTAADIEKLEECIRGTSSARSDFINRRKDKNSTEKLRWRKDQTLPYKSQFYDNISASADHPDGELAYHIDGNLATEFAMIVLDSLELVVQVATASEMHNSLLGVILKVLLHALSRNQSTVALQNLFASQRSLVFKFHSLLFDEESDSCADLCLLLLKHCGSQLPSVRSQAAASLYLLMRQNFEIGNNFARVKMQVTMSLSSLVGTSSTFSEQSLRKALKTILVYAESDRELQESSFPEQVRDLLFNLHMILSDTVKMKEYQEDPEMLLDLMHRIAKGYQNSPDLRLTWLENMAKKHMERQNHTEAAMCYVHSAALVAEYLSMLESQPHLPVGAVSFKHISPNCMMESAVSDDVLNPGEDGMCLGMRFTETGLKSLIEEAANSLQIAGMYEAMNDLYKVMIPICEANREFQKLGKIHGKLQEAFNRIAQLHGKRMFGTYFRVGFYGAKFGDLDKEEFIYKEPTLTKLPEIFARLQSFYADRFGSDSVEIIKDSNNVDVSKLDEDKAYIQITYVEPYFETYELRRRETNFERNFNIKRFIFATPFTRTGKAHGDLHEQWKRKTILTTSTHFPYVKTRIQVVHREQIVLEPIEVAIEDIQKKTNELGTATTQEPPDPKILQMVLQGCIGTTVNQGPLEMATVFLSDLSDGVTIPTKNQNKIRLCFKDFSKKCHDALKKNKNLIGMDQKDYQKELENNYKKFVEELGALIKITPAQVKGMVNSNSSTGGKYSSLRW